MAGQTKAVLNRTPAKRPDTQYALVAGLYAGPLLGPALVLAVSGVVSDAAILYITLLVAVAGITAVAGWLVSRTAGFAVVLGIYYAIAYHETRSLVAPIVAHNVVNGAIVTAPLLATYLLT